MNISISADRRNDVAVAAFEDGIRTGVQVENGMFYTKSFCNNFHIN